MTSFGDITPPDPLKQLAPADRWMLKQLVSHALEYAETWKRAALVVSGPLKGRYMEGAEDISRFLLDLERDARTMLGRLQ